MPTASFVQNDTHFQNSNSTPILDWSFKLKPDTLATNNPTTSSYLKQEPVAAKETVFKMQ